jgi:hypothetical protein
MNIVVQAMGPAAARKWMQHKRAAVAVNSGHARGDFAELEIWMMQRFSAFRVFDHSSPRDRRGSATSGLTVLMAFLLAGWTLSPSPALARPRPASLASTRPSTPPPAHTSAEHASHPAADTAHATIAGVFSGPNFNADGECDGLIVQMEGGRIAQVNLPRELASDVPRLLNSGDKLTIAVRPEARITSTHEVYQGVWVAGPKGRIEARSNVAWHIMHQDATIQRLNYDPRGDINGLVLDNGDFVAIGNGAASLDLKAGKKVAVEGFGRPDTKCCRPIRSMAQSSPRTIAKVRPGRPRSARVDSANIMNWALAGRCAATPNFDPKWVAGTAAPNIPVAPAMRWDRGVAASFSGMCHPANSRPAGSAA